VNKWQLDRPHKEATGQYLVCDFEIEQCVHHNASATYRGTCSKLTDMTFFNIKSYYSLTNKIQAYLE